MHILVATDADYVVSDVTAALGGPDVTFTVCREGRDVSKVVASRPIDLAVLDLQIGSMGGMAVTMALRLDESSGRLAHTKVLMLLDRAADVHLAKRSAAEAWLVKPVDALTLQRTARAVLAGTSMSAAPATTDDLTAAGSETVAAG
ncbi:MAG: response regulator [Ilumatobacteraceae bacterium]